MTLIRPFSALFVSLLAASAVVGCAFQTASEGDGARSEDEALSTSETFESGSKTAYAAANVNLSSGSWNMDDALIGTLSSDVKDGTAAARVRNSGAVTMNFDRTGAGIVTVKYATYGTDAAGTFGLYESLNHGSTWTKVGSTFSTATTLKSASFTVNVSGSVRFSLRKLDGSSNRIDLDDLSIGAGSNGTIGAGVTVPNSTFKVVAVLDQVGQGPADVTTSTRLIGVIMPNDDSQIAKADDWKPYRVSVRSIEALSGLNFLSDVSQSTQDTIETRVDNQ